MRIRRPPMHKPRIEGAAFVALATALLVLPGRSVPRHSSPEQAGLGLKPDALLGSRPVLALKAQVPLNFEANTGQTDSQVRFLSRNSGYTLFLTKDKAVFAFEGSRQIQ